MGTKALLAFLLVLLTPIACTITRSSDTATAYPIQEMETLADDVTLHVRIAGNPNAEKALIAIHGGPGMSSDYMLSLEQLAGDELAVATYDQRGTGQSTSPAPEPASYDLQKYVADLEAVRQAVGVENVHLLGHSWGGLVAMRYATIHPERVDSIILMGSGAPSRQLAEAGQASRVQRIQALQARGTIPKAITTVGDLLPSYFSDPDFELPDELKDLHYSPTAEQLTWAALGDFDFTAQVGQLDHRVLLLWGKDDPFGLPMAEATRGALSSAKVEFAVLENCGHFWHECPDGFFSSVRAFLGLPSTP
jgi:proline iminopeptidase